MPQTEKVSPELAAKLHDILKLMENNENLERPLKGSKVTFEVGEDETEWYVVYKTAEA